MSSIVSSEFSDIIANTNNRYLEQAKAQGNRIIGYTCNYIPEALLSVEGLVPIRVLAPGVNGTDLADSYLSNVNCSFTRSLLEYALDDYYEHLDGWVFAVSCDHLRRLYDNLVYLTKPQFAHIIDLPHKISEASIDWYAEELRILAAKLSESFGVDTGDNKITKAIVARNELLSVMREMGDLRKADEPRISGEEFHALLRVAMVTPARAIIGKMKDIVEQLKARVPVSGYRARLMVLGSELDDPKFIGLIEGAGGLVVADRYCTGSLPGMDAVDENPENPIRRLAEQKLKSTHGPRMMGEFNTRLENIIRLVKEYKADGVVVQIMKFCDLWSIESSALVPALREAGIPVLKLEREYRLSAEGQIKTRVQAFLESMGR